MPKSSRVSNVKGRIGYVVSVWPRLSETFILNEVLAVEGGGVPLRIFSVKNPVSGPVHARAGDVRAEVTCLGGVSGWRQALGPGQGPQEPVQQPPPTPVPAAPAQPAAAKSTPARATASRGRRPSRSRR